VLVTPEAVVVYQLVHRLKKKKERLRTRGRVRGHRDNQGSFTELLSSGQWSYEC
jgi:hypothetical protein